MFKPRLLRLSGAVLLPLLLVACGQKAPAPEAERAVRTLVLEPAQVRAEQVYAGELRARTESRLAFRVGGKVLARDVGLGQAVKVGQVLMRLDPTDLKLAVDAAEAQLRAARTQRDSQAADLKRFRELHAQGFIGNAELERRDAAYQSALAQFEQARAQASAQRNQAQYSALSADAAGVITAVEAEPGAVVAAGTAVLRLAHEGPRDAVFQVSETLVGMLRETVAAGGLSVSVAGLSEPVKASLREVAQAADPVTRTFLVKADIGQVAGLRLGQTATIRIAAPAQPGVVKVPPGAVFEAKGLPQVFVLDPKSMTLRAQPVQVAGADGNLIVVAGGLLPGQEVVSAGVHVLRDGEKVRRYGAAPAAPAASK